MFGWLKWGKPAHPMADAKTARQLVADLSHYDPAKALDKIATWLDSISQTKAFKLQDRLELIDLLDKAADAHQRKLAQEYLSATRLKKADEDRLWNASFGSWKVLGAAYLRCIENFKAGAAGADAIKKDLALVAARALRASSMQLKWTLLRHAQIDERIWRELGSTYYFAERQGVAVLRAEIYPGQRGQSSPQEELLKALMLVMASPYNLAPLKLRIAERVVAHFGSRFVLRGTPAPECSFIFDLSMPKAPARLRKEMAAGPMVRFFGAGEVERVLRDLMREVREKDGVPSDVNLGEHFDQEAVLSVLAHLARCWDRTPPERRAARNERVTSVAVVPGFPNILRCLELLASGAPLDPMNFVEQKSWMVFDKSDGGYGAFVPKERDSSDYDPLTGARTGSGDWLRIGALLAVCEENATSWRVGVVRRITYDGSGQCRVGIELLEGVAIVIKLAPASGPRAGEPEKRRSAVLLSDTIEKNDEALVLMRAGHFATTQNLSMYLGNEHYLLLPSALIESGDDFDCARFKVIPA